MDEIVVRTGDLRDMDEMMRLAIAATEENGFMDADIEQLAANIFHSLQMSGGIVGVIGKPGERLEGAILLRIGPVWYSREPILDEKAVFVDPEFRAAKGGRAKKLVEFAKKCSDELGLPLSIGVLSNEKTEAKIRLYERMLGKPAGVYFLYGARTGREGTT